MIIYKAVNIKNGKCYIGKTINSLQQRINSHKSESSLGRYDVAFHSAIRKYGFEVFEWEILCKCVSVEHLNKMEKHFIKKFNSYKKGYNETLGGDGQSVGYVPKKSTKDKLSIRAKNLWKDENHRKKVSEIHKARWDKNRDEIIKAQRAWAATPQAKELKSRNSKKMWQNKSSRENIRKKLNKLWRIVSVDGNEYVIDDLTKWCKEHFINRSTFYGYKNKDKSWKGYFLRSVENVNG